METNNNWRYTAVAITKYNPIYRDTNGFYTKGEWTSYYDIGKIFEGNLFSREAYLETESKYIKAANLFFDLHNCSSDKNPAN